MKSCSIFFFLLLLTGCSTSFGRFFQAKVPAPILKQEAQVEAERRSADLLAHNILTPPELRFVAIDLSNSLGKPHNPIVVPSAASLPAAATLSTKELDAGIVKAQEQVVDLNKNLTRYAGKEIEDTGVNLLGPGTITILLVLAVLGVIFPPVFTVLSIMYRRLKQTTSTIIDQIDVAAKAPETQEAVSTLKVELSKKMDMAHKKVVSSLQKL